MRKGLSFFFLLAFLIHSPMGWALIPDAEAPDIIIDAQMNLTISDEDIDEAFDLHSDRPSLVPAEGRVSSGFGPRRWGRRTKMHKGIDIAAPTGSPVVAPANGKIVFSGRKGAYGKAVMIDHGDGITTLFGHNSKLLVEEGQAIKKGEIIAKVGNTGRSTGPHCHYEVHKDGEPVDPSLYI